MSTTGSLLAGALRLLRIGGILDRTDAEAIRSDWAALGDDLRRLMAREG